MGPQRNEKSRSLNSTLRKMTAGASLLALVTVVALVIKGCSGTASAIDVNVETYTVRPGELVVDVLEAGELEASESQVIRSEVDKDTTIISIVPEGTIITEDDISESMVLVQLDSSSLEEELVERNISVQNAEAQNTEATEGLSIQKLENESNLKDAQLALKFARMDLDKHLGETVAGLFLESTGSLDQESTGSLEKLLKHPKLGGEALQRIEQLENDIKFAMEEETRAQLKLEWTEKLLAKGYVQPNDQIADQSAYDQKVVRTKGARTTKELYELYDFPKATEKLRTDYEKAQNALKRTESKNTSELAKAEVNLSAAKEKLKREQERLDWVNEQFGNCTIYATQPGLVVYARGSSRGDRDQAIGEGQTVRKRREMITIPNTTAMQVTTAIHESVITRVKAGQKAFITVDAMPDKKFSGTVTHVALLPDSQRGWMMGRGGGPKVYVTKVMIDEIDDQLKPGMGAQVRIITNELSEVLNVPIQSVGPLEDKLVCFVDGKDGIQIREVTTGEYNDKFVEIKSGLQDGEEVVLYAAQLIEQERM